MLGPLRSLNEDPEQGAFGQALTDPSWRRFFDILKSKGVGKLTGGPSAPGSTQLRGLSVQPDYFSGGPTFQGRFNMDYKPTAGPGQQGIVEGDIPLGPDPNAEGRQDAFRRKQATQGLRRAR